MEFANKIGMPEQSLREFISFNVNANNIDEFGRFEKLKQEIDIDVAQKYFEDQEGESIPRRKIHPKIDKLLRDFILNKESEE